MRINRIKTHVIIDVAVFANVKKKIAHCKYGCFICIDTCSLICDRNSQKHNGIENSNGQERRNCKP